MGAIASQITSLTIFYSTVYSGADQRIHQSSASLAFVWGIHRWIIPAQMASNAENVSKWWRHHVFDCESPRELPAATSMKYDRNQVVIPLRVSYNAEWQKLYVIIFIQLSYGWIGMLHCITETDELVFSCIYILL